MPSSQFASAKRGGMALTAKATTVDLRFSSSLPQKFF